MAPLVYLGHLVMSVAGAGTGPGQVALFAAIILAVTAPLVADGHTALRIGERSLELRWAVAAAAVALVGCGGLLGGTAGLVAGVGYLTLTLWEPVRRRS